MLGHVSTSFLGRQITSFGESWHGPTPKAVLRAVATQQSWKRLPRPQALSKAITKLQAPLSRHQATHHRQGAMHDSSSISGSNGAHHQATQHSTEPTPTSASSGNGASAPWPDTGLDPAFSSSTAEVFNIAIVGDLHLERKGMQMFNRARQQLKNVLEEPGSGEARVVQLGDLGGYNEKPGSIYCFKTADNYLRGFLPIKSAVVIGNHDLEGEEFETDEANLAAWTKVFKQRHYWSMELGGVLCLGISTTRFRSNAFSAHEIYIDEEQMCWFKSALREAAGRPVIVFSHAPPQGCGLTVIPGVHVKNRCAFLNHSSAAMEFMQLVEQYPNIALWFSGHFHLSHNYTRSISVVGSCAFVQTGVIGDCNRDGFRHSRVLKGNQEGYRLYTMDHSTGSLRLDLEHTWLSSQQAQPLLPPADQMCDDQDEEAWPSSNLPQNGASMNGSGSYYSGSRGDEHFAWEHKQRSQQRWMSVGHDRMLSLEEGMLVEYDVPSRAPIGAVFLSIEDDERVVLKDSQDHAIVVHGPNDMAGSAAVTVELQNASGHIIEKVARNQDGGFYQIFQQNKWRLRKEREAAAARRQRELSLR